MTTARSLVVDPTTAGYYNCTSRCVRRAFLCGDEHEHRRDWILDRLIELDEIFAVDVCAYAILHNHLHTLAYIDPNRAAGWSAEEVARRWVRLYPKCVPFGLDEREAILVFAADRERVPSSSSLRPPSTMAGACPCASPCASRPPALGPLGIDLAGACPFD